MFSKMTVDLSNFDWQGVSGAADALMVLLNVILIASVIVGYKGLKESVLSRDASLLTWAMQRMTDIKEDLEAIQHLTRYGTVADLKNPRFSSPWVPEMEGAAYRVSIELQRLAYLANAGLISKVHFQRMWGPTFVRAWDVLEVWVKHKRQKKGEPLELSEGAFTRNDFETFAIECTRT